MVRSGVQIHYTAWLVCVIHQCDCNYLYKYGDYSRLLLITMVCWYVKAWPHDILLPVGDVNTMRRRPMPASEAEVSCDQSSVIFRMYHV